ncbi:MAG TPA: hypothetical protein VGB56_11040, partial [Flavisolibacter sp.]
MTTTMNCKPLTRLTFLTSLPASLCFVLILLSSVLFAQDSAGKEKVVVAGPHYERSSFYKFFWGEHYRKEWTTPVRVPIFHLDTAFGGLTPYERGGGRQSATLRLRNPSGREYVIRSIDKSFARALPPIFRKTFVEDAINDQVSIAHPFAAVTIPPMAQAARIYHTTPRIVYIPAQPRLDSFNADYGNQLYLVEQRPDENWDEAANFGFSKNIIGTEKLFEKIFGDNDNRIDQKAYVRARLFDIFVGDWGRHEDQWRWASFDSGNKTIYHPIPRDRDQAYTLFDGVLVRTILSLADLDHLQTFKPTIRDIAQYNFPARNMDRQLANETTREDWLRIATELKEGLTDGVIENAVRQLPPELFPISGPAIISKLKRRRDDLLKHASDYYLSLAKEVDVVGTKEEELFEVTRLDRDQTRVALYKIDKMGVTESAPFYSRLFRADETKEIRLSGLASNDVYRVTGTADKGILVRIIGGPQRDSIIDLSQVGRERTLVYDNADNAIVTSNSTELHLTEDTAVHQFDYNAFEYDDKGIKPSISYGNDDRLYVGLGYKVTRHKWRKQPFGSEHIVAARYSLTQGGVSISYNGTIVEVPGKWNMHLFADLDAVRWTQFFGLGNNTALLTDDNDFYRMRSRELFVSTTFRRRLGNGPSVAVAPFYQIIDIINDTSRFVAKVFRGQSQLNESKGFGGLALNAAFSRLNDRVVPTKGIQVSATATHTRNVYGGSGAFTR